VSVRPSDRSLSTASAGPPAGTSNLSPIQPVNSVTNLSGSYKWGSPPAARGRWQAKLAGGGAGGGSFDINENRFQALIPQDVTGANAQDRHPSLREPCLTILAVAGPSSGVVCEPIHLDR
jgi:hypothetical protein